MSVYQHTKSVIENNEMYDSSLGSVYRIWWYFERWSKIWYQCILRQKRGDGENDNVTELKKQVTRKKWQYWKMRPAYWK